jgi:toxin ParE1/3/4
MRLLRACVSAAKNAAEMARIVFSEFVEGDLAVIWEYIAIDNIDAADRFLEAAYGTFQELARMPLMGRARHFPQAQLQHLRSFLIKDFEKFLIFYLPLPDGIEVLHVIHGARDLEQFWEGP